MAQVRVIVWGNGRLGIHVRPRRGVLHMPYKYSARNKRIDLKSENVHPIPLEMIEGRIKNAYT